MHNPPHPGQILNELYIQPLGLTITKTAISLGVSRKTVSEIVNEKSGISPEMAFRLSRAFGTTPESWLNMQQQYDLWLTKNSLDRIPEYQKIKPLFTSELLMA